MNLQFLLAGLVVTAGAFFLLIGSIGLVRLPDVYSRAHATGKSDTLGVILVILGLVIHEGWTLNGLKLVLITAFVGLTNPTATHALTRAAIRFGIKPWFRKDAAAGREK